jgi:hypothetical protein
MKTRHFSLLVIFSVFSTILSAQVSIKQADSIVQKYIEKEITKYYLLYSNENIVADKNGVTTVSIWNKEPISINKSCFVYFIDENPYASWEHSCRYLFVNKSNGQIHEETAKTPPKNLNTWKLLTPILENEQKNSFDFLKNLQKSTPLKSGINPSNCYAVIISGGIDMANNWQRYWNDCSSIYSVLTYVYGYLDNHIYVLMSDGTNPANDRRVSTGYDSSPLDLDGDGDNDIQYSATKANIATVFNTLSNILTENDYLFIFTTDHGGTSSGHSTLCLWGENIYDYEFANEVNKVKAGNISVVMEQCRSGGFIDDLEKTGRTIATACKEDENSYGMGYYTYNYFVYYWTAAVARYTPSGTIVNADSNNDGYISMKEAFDYANTHTITMEHPQYSSKKTHLGNYLTLLGTQACTTTNLLNQTVNTNKTVTDCKINVQNVTVTNNKKLTLDAVETTINGSFEVQLGSELEIK